MRIAILVLMLVASINSLNEDQVSESNVKSFDDRDVNDDPQGVFKIQGKVYGGVDATYGDIPWQVIIIGLKRDNPYSRTICGGSIINEFWVLTAAHCFLNSNLDIALISAGQHSIRGNEAGEQMLYVEKVIHYPDFNYTGLRCVFPAGSKYKLLSRSLPPDFCAKHFVVCPVSSSLGIPEVDLVNSSGYDIALVKIKPKDGKGIQFTRFVQPIPLADVNTKYRLSSKCIISGWGRTKSTDTTYTDKLQVANIWIRSSRLCKMDYPNVNLKRSVCVSRLGKTGGAKGDSGGPLACKVRGKYTLFGVMVLMDWDARGNLKHFLCVRVATYADWITSVITKS